MAAVATPLGDYIKGKRDDAGWSQARLAEDIGTSPAYLSQIESGRVSLPGADLRRRIAKALGVSHLDLLVEAGEITREELGKVAGIVEQDPTDPRHEFGRLIERIRLTPDRERTLRAILRNYLENDPHAPR